MRQATAVRDRFHQPEPAVKEPVEIIGGREDCVHHWIIDSPAGAVSAAFCKVCGARRVFSNYVSDFIYEGDSTDTLPVGAWKKPVSELVKPDSEGNSESSPWTEGDY